MSAPKAPLYIDSGALCVWLHQRLSSHPDSLPRAICEHALRLYECIVLALEGHRRVHHIVAAHEVVVMLRANLRLTVELDYLSNRQLLYALERTDTIVRQLAGWRRSAGSQNARNPGDKHKQAWHSCASDPKR